MAKQVAVNGPHLGGQGWVAFSFFQQKSISLTLLIIRLIKTQPQQDRKARVLKPKIRNIIRRIIKIKGKKSELLSLTSLEFWRGGGRGGKERGGGGRRGGKAFLMDIKSIHRQNFFAPRQVLKYSRENCVLIACSQPGRGRGRKGLNGCIFHVKSIHGSCDALMLKKQDLVSLCDTLL